MLTCSMTGGSEVSKVTDLSLLREGLKRVIHVPRSATHSTRDLKVSKNKLESMATVEADPVVVPDDEVSILFLKSEIA